MNKLLQLDNQLCFSLYLATKTLIQLYQPFLQPLGLTYPQYITMLVLWESDHITVSELGERLHLDSGTLSPLLKKLESKKLVKKHRHPEDERVVTISLTAAGKAMKAEAECMLQDLIKKSGLKNQETQDLRLGLRQLTDKLLMTLQAMEANTDEK